MKFSKEQCRKALYGGLLLGGGGGGTLDKGLAALEETFRYVDYLEVKDIEEIAPEALIVNASMVGSPSAKNITLTAEDWKITLENFRKACGDKEIAGFTSCENGAAATANGWLASAVTGVPMVDAPSNGRAHPTGTMGSIGLNLLPDYVTVQAATGGEGSRRVEMVTRGGIEASAHLVRQSAAADGGMVGVLRNPAAAAYVAEHAAVGGFKEALKIGEKFFQCGNDAEKFISCLASEYEAETILKGRIREYSLKAKGGFDIGAVTVENGSAQCRLTFWNEYMTAETNGERRATFPDLICLINAADGMAVTSAEAEEGMEVYVISIPHRNVILGAGLLQKKLYEEVGELFETDMVTPNEDLFI